MDGNADLRWAAPFYPAPHRTYSPKGRSTRLRLSHWGKRKGPGRNHRKEERKRTHPGCGPTWCTQHCAHIL